MRLAAQLSNRLLERGLIPDPVIRVGIRGLLKDKLQEERDLQQKFGDKRLESFIKQLNESPIAVNTREANEQHYEVPTDFFQCVLGKHMKYSCGYWPEGVKTLDASEESMLDLTVTHAHLSDGQKVLELGCGWGSLTLYMAARFPRSKIVGVSNSATQREYILRQAKARHLNNVRIITADMNAFAIDEKFDRVVSVEMFEHMRNYQKLLQKVADFLNDDGMLFVHIFTHKEFSYLYDEKDKHDWIAKYFFTGGIMPSNDLLLGFQDKVRLQARWFFNGSHYQKTSEAWLKNMERNRKQILPILKSVYGAQYRKWWVYWKVFFMSCAELWGYSNGEEWMVCHYLFNKRK